MRLDANFPYWIPIGFALGMLWWWARARGRRRSGVAIDPNDPRWIEAIAKARSTIDEMRRLNAIGTAEIYVKYQLRTKSGGVEHVWGKLLELSAQDMKVSLETRPLQRPDAVPPFTIPLTDIEDWQSEQPDGSIRGGFTTRAQIAIARSARARLPAHIAELEGKFTDEPPQP